MACVGCGLVWSDPRPHDPRRFYEDEYRVAYKGCFSPKAKHVLRAGRVALARLRAIEPLLRPGLRALDVGSGGGEFAYLLKTRGLSVVGVEPNRGYAGYAAREHGLQIERGFIDEVTLAPQSFDLITLWLVLEHTADPGGVLARLRSVLRADGVLVVEVPNVEATCQSPRSTFHEAHLYNFNEATLRRLGEKAGLRAESITLSPDGGNLTAVFRAQAECVSGSALRLPGNHARVAAAVRSHTPIRHWLRVHPYRRTFDRLYRAVEERLALLSAPRGRALLDRLYSAPDPARVRPALWPAIASLFAFALFFEEVFVDRVLPAYGWTEAEALVPYFGAQAAALVGATWMAFRRGYAAQRLAILLAAALPVFALPSYC